MNTSKKSKATWRVAMRGSCSMGLLLLACCSASSSDEGKADTGAGADMEDGGSGDDTGVGDAQDARWWRLAATFDVLDGVPSPAGAALRVGRVDALGVEVCSGQAPVLTFEPKAEPVVDGVLVWWQVVPGEWTSDCSGALSESPLPQAFLLGVGNLHIEIAAQMGNTGVEASLADHLNGAYFGADGDEDVVVFGLAGPAAAYSGTGLPASTAPLADGEWEIRPVYSLL